MAKSRGRLSLKMSLPEIKILNKVIDLERKELAWQGGYPVNALMNKWSLKGCCIFSGEATHANFNSFDSIGIDRAAIGSAMCQFDSMECCRGVDGATIASEAIPRLDR